MKKYEYMVITVIDGSINLKDLDKLGSEGWEVIIITEQGQILLKRELA